MQKIENIYKHGNAYLITNNPEWIDEDLADALVSSFSSPLDLVNNIDVNIIKERIEKFSWFKTGWYTDKRYNNRIVYIKEYDKKEVYRQACNGRIFWCKLDYYDLQGNCTNRTSSSYESDKQHFDYIWESKEEALEWLKSHIQKIAARDFIDRTVWHNLDERYSNWAKFLFNACVELLNTSSDIEKYMTNWSLNINTLRDLLKQKAVSKEEFKERFKKLKSEWILVMFK